MSSLKKYPFALELGAKELATLGHPTATPLIEAMELWRRTPYTLTPLHVLWALRDFSFPNPCSHNQGLMWPFAGLLCAKMIPAIDMSGEDFSGLDMSGIFLDGACLAGTKLVNTDLRNSCIRRADLKGADLRGADLRGAFLYGSDVSCADFSGAIMDSTTSGKCMVGVESAWFPANFVP